MNKKIFNKRPVLRWKHFSRRGYALFACLGREVIVGTLSVATLTCAKAEGISTKPMAANDSITHEAIQLDELQVTGTRVQVTVQETPRIVKVIGREDIQKAEATTVNDLLKLATGVDVRQRGGFGVQTDISINGGTFDQIAILLNGLNLSNPQTGHNAADFPVSLNDIDRIEILEGASARVIGASAFSGAINIVTRPLNSAESAHNLSRQRAGRAGGWLGTEGGSFGSIGADAGVSLTTHIHSPAGSKAFYSQLSGGYQQSDGGTENSEFRKRRIYYQGGFRNDNLNLFWQAGIASQDYGANTFYSAKYNNQYEETRRYIGSVSADWQLHLPSQTTLTLTPSLYGHRNYDHYQLIRGKTGAKAGENYHRMDVFGGMINALLFYEWGSTTLRTDLRQENILSTAYGNELPDDEQKAIKGSDRSYSRKGERTNTSIFAEQSLSLGKFNLSAGLLYHRVSALSPTLQATSSWSPGIDISYELNDHLRLYASWNKALRVPTYTDLYTDNPAQQGDLALKAERNSTFKAGMHYRTGPLETTLSGFHSKGTNMIDWVYESENDTRYHALNIGKLDNMGFSLDCRLRLATLFGSLRSLNPQLRVGYAYLHQTHETTHEIHKSLYALEYLRHKLTAQLDHHLWNRLSACWSLRWQQRMNGYHPYAKLDGKLMWDAPSYTLYLKADNLTAHRYYDLGTVRQPGLWLMAGGCWKF